MEILFLGSFFPDYVRKTIIDNSIGVVQNAGDTFQQAVLTGLIQHGRCNHIITSPMIGSYPKRYSKIRFEGGTFEYKGIQNCISTSFNNLSIYKTHSKYKSVKKQLVLWANRNSGEKQIVVFSLDIPLLKAVSELKNTHDNIHICLIVTDLLEFMVVPKSLVTNTIIKFYKKRSEKYLQSVDSYVLLTKYMKSKLGIENKPFIVIEGLYDTNYYKTQEFPKEKNKTILYSGTLAKAYGILHLLDSFNQIENSDYRLWICGDGDCKAEILKRQLTDNRIKYFGQIKREEVLELQRRATVLTNPRMSDSEFTMYSFASKTMEYLASGTPLIMHPLLCLTDDYLKHIFIANDETNDGLKRKIIQVCETDEEELNQFGKQAALFIYEQKNAYAQVAKILELIDHEK
jgi:glycosyltransferase involved in cell wall biosynthesis